MWCNQWSNKKISHKKPLWKKGKAFIFNKNEGNNQKVENKVLGRVRVGVGKALLSQ